VLQAVQSESDLRVRLLEMQDELERATRTAIRVLMTTHRYSYRDAGQLLGITHQRVEQISKLMSQADQSSENPKANEF
jgi:hypothetical protein